MGRRGSPSCARSALRLPLSRPGRHQVDRSPRSCLRERRPPPTVPGWSRLLMAWRRLPTRGRLAGFPILRPSLPAPTAIGEGRPVSVDLEIPKAPNLANRRAAFPTSSETNSSWVRPTPARMPSRPSARGVPPRSASTRPRRPSASSSGSTSSPTRRCAPGSPRTSTRPCGTPSRRAPRSTRTSPTWWPPR